MREAPELSWGAGSGGPMPEPLGRSGSGLMDGGMHESRGCPGVWMTEAQGHGDLEPWAHVVPEPRMAKPTGRLLGGMELPCIPLP